MKIALLDIPWHSSVAVLQAVSFAGTQHENGKKESLRHGVFPGGHPSKY